MISCGIDLGSNTIRIIIAEVIDSKITEILYSHRAVTRLAGNIHSSGRLSDEGVEKTLKYLKLYKSEIDRFNVCNVFVAATSAIREAENSYYFINKAASIGIDVHIISGEEEAYYTFLGMKSNFTSFIKDAFFYDIGGGSTELTHICDDSILFSKSIKMGVVKLSDMFGFNRPVSFDIIKECTSYVHEYIFSEFDPTDVPLLIGTAGTVTSIAAIELKMVDYDPGIISKHILSESNLNKLIYMLMPLSSEDKLKIPGVYNGREDLIIPGIIIVKEIMKLCSCKISNVSDFGLREGLAIAAVS